MSSTLRLEKLTVAVTKNCNLRCVWCFESADAGVGCDMADGTLSKVVREMRQVPNLRKITLTGGEPFCHPKIRSLIETAHDQGRNAIAITTNGHLLDAELLAFLAERKVALRISVDGDESAHDRVRGSGSYRKVVDAIRTCLNEGIFIGVTCTVARHNLKKVAHVVETCRRLGVANVKFQRMRRIGFGENCCDEVLTASENKWLTGELARLQKKYHGTVFVGYKDPFIHTLARAEGADDMHEQQAVVSGCRCGVNYLFLSCDGIYMPCPFLRLPLGDAAVENVADVWSRTVLLDAFLVRDCYEHCGSCEFWGKCRGCRAESFIAGNGVFGSDPACWRNHG